ncbi:MAG: SBBP repeat-containing protein, partial [Nitrospira sp.]|nr:SBBP repeat-containing protein [Nitrospira sp.]
ADFDPGPGTFNLTSFGSDDVFISKLDSTGNFVWAAQLGGSSFEESFGIAVDGGGNVYTTGRLSGIADFDPGPGTFNLTSAGFNDVFISKLDSAGNFVWARQLGGTGGEVGNDIVVDGSGNVYTTGNFNGTADFDPGLGTFNLTPIGFSDVFISKLDSAGNFLWARQLGGISSSNVGNSISLDSSNNVYTTGGFTGIVDFDPSPGIFNLTSFGSLDVFISKLDSTGNFVSAQRLGGGGFDQGLSIVVDGSGNVYTTGSFDGTADFDPGSGTSNLTSAGFSDAFVSSLGPAVPPPTPTPTPPGPTPTPTPTPTPIPSAGGIGNDEGHGIAVDGSGNVYTTGFFSNTADFDPGPNVFTLTSAGGADVFISKLDNVGNFVWARQVGGTGNDNGREISVDGSGNVHIIGVFNGTVDFDPGPGTFNLTSGGFQDVFILKLDSAGNFVWARQLVGSPGSFNVGQSVTVDGSGNVYASGEFSDTVDFDPGPNIFNLASIGVDDGFILKLDNAGNFIWAR